MGLILGPERPGGQGLDSNQEESGNRAILALLRDPKVAEQVDLVITYRYAAYEVWAARGMVRFQRVLRNGQPAFAIVEQIGENPLGDQCHTAVATCDEELQAAAASGHPTEDVNRAFIEPAELTYPYAYERVAQLFDSPYAPDLAISPKCYSFRLQPGQHGALDVVQSRAPLAFAGPGIRPGDYSSAPRHVDIAPTICHLMGFPLIDGKDWSGRTASQRGCGADVYLRRQDGRVLNEIIANREHPHRVYFIIFDGLSNSELQYLLDRNDPAVANLRRILDRSARFRFGSTVNFPTITWPSHSTIFTGAWCGHHDIVNPVYYERESRQGLAPQAEGTMTEKYLSGEVETLYEAFHRVLGADCFTANIYAPQGRGADHAALEGRVVGARERLQELTSELKTAISPRYLTDGFEAVHREAILDARGIAQLIVLFDDPSHPQPVLVAHEFILTDGAGHDYGPHGDGLRTAIAESDRRLGQALDMLAAKGLTESTLFVFTSDHGMAAQDVSLQADPARHTQRIGMKTVIGENMIWLCDLDVQIEPSAGGSRALLTVLDNDPDPGGEKPPVASAEVLAQAPSKTVVAHLKTNQAGIAEFATPADVPPAEIAVAVLHPEYNPRHLRLDGKNLTIDLRRELYGTRGS